MPQLDRVALVGGVARHRVGDERIEDPVAARLGVVVAGLPPGDGDVGADIDDAVGCSNHGFPLTPPAPFPPTIKGKGVRYQSRWNISSSGQIVGVWSSLYSMYGSIISHQSR